MTTISVDFSGLTGYFFAPMQGYLSNPGNGAIESPENNYENAKANVVAFAQECGAVSCKLEQEPTDGRWPFELHRGGRKFEGLMPGLPLERVRYTEGQNPFSFPRLYIEGNSWLWKLAINIVTA